MTECKQWIETQTNRTASKGVWRSRSEWFDALAFNQVNMRQACGVWVSSSATAAPTEARIKLILVYFVQTLCLWVRFIRRCYFFISWEIAKDAEKWQTNAYTNRSIHHAHIILLLLSVDFFLLILHVQLLRTIPPLMQKTIKRNKKRVVHSHKSLWTMLYMLNSILFDAHIYTPSPCRVSNSIYYCPFHAFASRKYEHFSVSIFVNISVLFIYFS